MEPLASFPAPSVTIAPIGSSSTKVSKPFWRRALVAGRVVAVVGPRSRRGCRRRRCRSCSGRSRARSSCASVRPSPMRVEAVGVLRGRVGADRDLLAVAEPVAVGVGLASGRVCPLSPVALASAVGRGRRRRCRPRAGRSRVELDASATAVAVGVGAIRVQRPPRAPRRRGRRRCRRRDRPVGLAPSSGPVIWHTAYCTPGRSPCRAGR